MNRKLFMTTILLFSALTVNCQNTNSMKDFAIKLLENKVCTEHMFKKLLAVIQNEEIKNNIDFLNYCSNSVVIELGDYSNIPIEYLESIHRETASIIPNFEFNDFDFEINRPESRVVISIKSNGKNYKQKSYLDIDEIGKQPGMEYFGKIGHQEYYKIFNKVLVDKHSPLRLHVVEAYNNNALDWNRFGIIALTKEQADMLHKGGVYFSPSYENFKINITTKKKDNAISEFIKLGLLSHLNEEQLLVAREKVKQKEIENFNTLIGCFPDVIYSFDTELGNLENPYEEFLLNLRDISRMRFNPLKIIDNYSTATSNTCRVEFQLNGKNYVKELLVEDDWIDISFLQFINMINKENEIKGNFILLFTDGQDASIVYLEKQEEKYLRDNHLLEFADQ